MKQFLSKIIFLTYASFTPFSLAFAQCVPGAGKICNPIDQENLNDFIKTLLEGVIKIGIPIVALAIIYCGFLFVQARGKPDDLTKAKDALLYTLIGAAILLGAWALAILISETVIEIGTP